MPRLEDQLGAYARHLDDAVNPVPVDGVLVPEAVVMADRRRAPRRAWLVAVAAGMAAAVAAGVIAIGHRSNDTAVPTSSPGSPAAGGIDLRWSGGGTVLGDQVAFAVFNNPAQLRVDLANMQLQHRMVVTVPVVCQTVQRVVRRGTTVTVVLDATRPNVDCSPEATVVALERAQLPAGSTTFTVAVEPSGSSLPRPSVTIDLSNPQAFARVGDVRPGKVACVPVHAPGDIYSLRQPTTLTLPGGAQRVIVPGNPITKPRDVTLDSMGLMPGAPDPQGGAPGLWGAATAGGPFAGLDRVAIGAVVTLAQGVSPSDVAVTERCTQRWKVAAVGTTPIIDARPVLRLVGFTPHGTAGPDAQFYVDLVPA